ncbi:hypothetical protein M885DRAFT_545458 [Pelagophyceae sp. CCMP2097]|nr:hypothetical protein M885DRAFT_545458 [Pelagophyceae sp. CCMP2097]
MPLDINLLRTYRGGDPEKVRESQRRRFKDVDLVDRIIAEDEIWRNLTLQADEMRASKNAKQLEITKLKKAKQEVSEAMLDELKELDRQRVDLEAQCDPQLQKVTKMLSAIGNLVDDSVVVSKDEAKDNEVVSSWQGPTGTARPTAPRSHHELLYMTGGYEPERGVRVAGHRGYFLTDVGVLLNQAIINYSIAFVRPRAYKVIQPPFFMNKDVMAGVAQLEQFDEELYHVQGSGDDDGGGKYLIATSEQPICAYHKGEWLAEAELPLKYCGISTCFRKEAGSHGRDTWGIFRVHQFEKVEQFVIVDCDEGASRKMHEEMRECAEDFVKSLGFPYRVVNIVSGELNNAAVKKYDLEAWFPFQQTHRELVSCSNCTDYQSRAMEIRCGQKKAGQNEKKYVHMLNSTLAACGRTICCLLENYQTDDGVNVPEVLRPFMGGMAFMPFVREMDGSPYVSAAPAAPVSPEEAAAASAIAVASDALRSLKEAKAAKPEITASVEALKALKAAFEAAFGKEYLAPGQKPSAASKDKKKAAQPPAPPARAERRAPGADEAPSKEAAALRALEAALLYRPFVQGYAATREDAITFASLAQNTVDAARFPNVARWLAHVQSFDAAARASWA